MSKWLSKFGIFSLLVLGTILVWLTIHFVAFLRTPLSPNKSFDYILKPGSSVRALANDLYDKGLIEHPNFLIVLAYGKGNAKNLKAGEYLFAPGIKPAQLLKQIAEGKVIYQKFTIVEGWTFNQLLSALSHDPNITHTLENATPVQIVEKLKLPPQSPEGLFFPATYHFTKGMKDIELLKKANRLMNEKLNQAWQERSNEITYKSSYEALIAASLVEKETAQAHERPLVAGVLTRRLQKNMPLQIDSTVVYGLGATYGGKLHSADLRQDTPYNTYTRRGLPPTPIAIPSLQSIKAVLHPDNSDSLYFVAKGDGTHLFSANLSSHNAAVKTYQIDIHLPDIAKKPSKIHCPNFWYLGERTQQLLDITCLTK